MQLATPLVFFVLPALFLALCHARHVLLGARLGSLLIGFVELYGCANALVTICVVRPYRRCVAECVHRCLPRVCCCGGGPKAQSTSPLNLLSTSAVTRSINELRATPR